MKNINQYCAALCFLLACSFCADIVFAPKAIAASNDNVAGWAWSENIGWVSFNNISGGGSNYGVDIDEGTGEMSGWAWSENIGWVSFNESDLSGCPSGDCRAKVDTSCPGGQCPVSGWARVLSAKNDLGNSGGWNGWINLRGTAGSGGSYGVTIDQETGDFHGWAWSDMVLGWLNFNSADSGAGGRSYKVYTTASFGPIAKMSCGGSLCSYGTCNNNPGATWIAYPPIQQCPVCIFSVKDESQGNVRCAYWKLTGPATYSYLASGAGKTINLSAFANNIIPGNYTLSLTVSDTPSSNCSAGNKDTVTRAIQIKQGVNADFVCSFDNPFPTEENPTPNPTWQDCTSTLGKSEFAKKITKGGVVYVKDISTPSGGATTIVDYDWRFTIDGVVTTANGDIASFTAGRDNKIELDVFDNATRENCIDVLFNNIRSLPKWEEINPVGMIWRGIASLAQKVLAAE